MNTYEVTVELTCTYVIDAPTKEMAEERAYDYFCECEPNFTTKEITGDTE